MGSKLPRIFILPYEIQSMWMDYLSLAKLFQLREINKVLKDFIEYYLRSYFRSGPEIIAWYTAYDSNRKLLHSFRLACKKNVQTEYTMYTCMHDNTDDALYDQLYFVFPREGQTTVVELNVFRAWITMKLVRMFSLVPKKNFHFQPHKPWLQDSDCPNAAEGDTCPANCVRMGGIQVEFLQDLKLSDKDCLSSDPRSLMDFLITEVDIGAQVLSAYPRIFNQVHIMRGPESPEVPYEIEINGAKFRLEDYKMILPQNPHLLDWYDRLTLSTAPKLTTDSMTSRPYYSFFELDNWTPTDELNRCRIPLFYKKRNSKVLLCHDYKGGYLEDADVQGSSVDKCYTLSKFWSLLDIFVYFSHHTITVPPVCWTQAAHTNDVLVLGTVITEGAHGQLENLLMIFGNLKNKSSYSHKYANILVDIAIYYNFDGWFLNLESPLPKEYIPHLIDFLKYFTTRMHQAKPGSMIIWYDALTREGDVDWQDKLSRKNKDFFDVVDGIFTNYTWKSNYPRESAALAGDRNYDVFTGIDFWGRGQYGGGGFNVHKAIREIISAKTSVGLFASAWSWEYLGKESFEINETRLWTNSCLTPILPDVSNIPSTWPDINDLGCITDYLESRPLTHSFNTFFNIGFGSKYFIEGNIVSDKKNWTHLGRSDLFPNILTTSYQINYDDAFHGGSSIVIMLDRSNFDFNRTINDRLIFPLFKTDFDVESGLNINLQIKHSNPKNSKIELYLLIENIDGKEVPWFQEIIFGNGWTTVFKELNLSDARKVKIIGLTAFDIRIGNNFDGIITIGRLGAYLSSEPKMKQQETIVFSVNDTVYDEPTSKFIFYISWPSMNARLYEVFLNNAWVGTALTSNYRVSLPPEDMFNTKVKISGYDIEGEAIMDLHGMIEF